MVPDYLIGSRVERIRAERLQYDPPKRLAYPTNSIITGTAPDPNYIKFAEDYETILGLRPGIIHIFVEIGKDDIEPIIEAAQIVTDYGYLVIWSFGPHPKKPAFDELDDFIYQLSALDGPKVVRPWFERNAEAWTNAWYGKQSSQEYTDMWGAFYEKCKQRMDDIYFIYAPNVSTMDSVSSVLKYVPDPKHFDITAFDLYNKKSIYRTEEGYYAQDYFTAEEELGKDTYDVLYDPRTAGKPLMISEVNASVEAHRGGWIASVYQYAIAHGVCAVVSFDKNKQGYGWDEIAWSYLTDPKVVQAIRHEFENNYYYRGHFDPYNTLNIMLSQPLNKMVLPQAA